MTTAKRSVQLILASSQQVQHELTISVDQSALAFNSFSADVDKSQHEGPSAD